MAHLGTHLAKQHSYRGIVLDNQHAQRLHQVASRFPVRMGILFDASNDTDA
jgi:hypothetical protein